MAAAATGAGASISAGASTGSGATGAWISTPVG
jgi:hypothetical protein